ncbi:MAG: hypothetical protein IKY63_01930 [Tidjanibacter sp.]|nr:hypothetical protein [Tidjanibacter sp.]
MDFNDFSGASRPQRLMVDGRRSTKKRAVDANRLICDESWQDVIMTDLTRPAGTLP